MAETTHTSGEVCLNCGHVLSGPFCAQCGQAEHDARHPTFGHFLHDLVHEFVHVDGTIFRTIKALFFHPGKLTQEYWAGHIVAWVRPIRLFLVIAAIHLLLSTGVSPFNWRVRPNHDKGGFNLYQGRPMIDNEGKPLSQEERESVEEFKHAYDSVRYGTFLMYGAASWLLYRRKQPFFANHIVAGLHFYSFWYCFSLLASMLGKLKPDLNFLSLLAFIYLFLTLRRLFQEHWLLRIVKTLALIIAIIWAELMAYIAASSWVLHHPKL